MKIRTNDKVKIIAGKDKGKIGKVLKVLLEKNKIIVEGVNIVKRHVKPGAISKEGGIVSIEKPINVSNAMYFNEKIKEPVRLSTKVIDGKKYRICKKTGEVIDK